VRRLLTVLLAVLALAAAGSVLVWRWAELRLEDGVAQWRAGAQTDGWTVTSGPTQRGGWPLAAELVLPDLAVTVGAPEVPAGAAWRAARLALRVDLLRPGTLLARVTGAQAVKLGAGPEVGFTADRFAVTLPLAADRPPGQAALDASQVRVGPPIDGLTFGLLQGQAAWQPSAGAGVPAITLRLSAEAIALPPPPAPQAALGSHIASATVEGVLTGPLPAPAGPYAMAAAWRAGGGALSLERIAVGWGPLGVTGRAALAFDAAMQPAGTADLRLVGVDDALAALVAGHTLPAATAQAARAVLGLLTLGAGPGEAGVAVPLTLRDQTLAMGSFPLARLPRLLWPDAPGSATVQ